MNKKAKDKPHYVDNKKFLQAMIDWRESSVSYTHLTLPTTPYV